MPTIIPKTSAALKILLRADFTTQWRNRRSFILVLLVPVIILFSWKPVIEKFGGAFALSTCITIGLIAIGLMGYSNSVARDRDKGVFQRLRVAPVPNWLIMVSRLSVQLAMIILLTAIVFIAGYKIDHVTLSASGYALTFVAAIVGGAVYLSLGQLIVGMITNPETVNSTTRLIYFVFIMVGMFADLGALWPELTKAVHWSPYGTVKTMLAASMVPSKWTNDTSMALLATLGYTLVLGVLGIKEFKWSAR